MTRILLLAAAFLVACSTTQAREPVRVAGNALAADDLREINGIIGRWQNAWNSHDMHAFAQLFHEDATWIVWTGLVWRGRQAIEDGHVAAHRTFFRDTTLSLNPQETRRVAPGVVVVRLIATVAGDSREAEPILDHKLLVLTRRDGAWRILYGQNTRLTPAVAATAR